MASARATTSTSRWRRRRRYASLVVFVFCFGLGVGVLAQDHRFRINVHEPDYLDQHRQPLRQSYRDYRVNDPTRQRQSAQRYVEEQYQQQQQQQQRQPIILKKEEAKKDEQDFSKIPGIPGVDFPIYHSVPKTSFSCLHVPYLPGMYANVETGCQAYHVCHDGREGDQGASFLCSNGTLFNQNEFACDWWYNVNCAEAYKQYRLNGDASTNPFVPKAKKDEILRERLKIVVLA